MSRDRHHIPASRPGISLLEVLITIFVVSVGLLSVFGLFMAGRELESRALILERADAFARGPGANMAAGWLRATQWQRYERGVGFRWMFPQGVNPSGQLKLPVVVDPWGLASDTFAGAPGNNWDWDYFAPFATPTPSPFARVTLPRMEQSPRANGEDIGANGPLTQDQALSLFADPDSIEYDPDPENAQDPIESPLNAFDLGRRRRGTDLCAALYLDKIDAAASWQIRLGDEVDASLLIFHKPIPGYEEPKQQSGEKWPAGFVLLTVRKPNPLDPTVPPPASLFEATIATGPPAAPVNTVPLEKTAIQRSLRAGKWALAILERAGAPPEYDTHWTKIVSASAADADATSWLVILDGDLPQRLKDGIQRNDKFYLLACECLVHVRPLGRGRLEE